MNVYYQNVRGLRTKTDTLYAAVLTEEYDIIACTETWLYDGIMDSELFDSRYEVIRKDRESNMLGGGVLLAIKRDVPYEIIDCKCYLELVLVKVKLKKFVIYLSVVYFKPNSLLEQYESYFNIFDDIMLEDSNLLIMGHFNLSHLCLNGSSSTDILMSEFLSINNLQQVNGVANSMGRFLDLVVSNLEIALMGDSDCPLVPEDAYHPALNMLVSVGRHGGEALYQKQYTYNYARGNFDLLYQLVADCDWASLYDCKDVDDAVDAFYDRFYKCLDASIPKKCTPGVLRKPRFPSWFSRELIGKINKKNGLHNRVKNEKADEYERVLLVTLRKEIKLQTKEEYTIYKRNIEQNINCDPQSFWAFINNMNKGQSGLPTEMSRDGIIYKGSSEISNAFAQFFSSVYENNKSHTRIEQNWGNFNFAKVTEEDILISIKKLKAKKTTGPDNIPSYIYKGCADFLLKPLMFIFNLAISKNYFPDLLKMALVSPIHKSGSKNNIEHYRPISLINVIGKIFESVIFDRIMSHVWNEISFCQHGFVADRSTVTNLCVFAEHVSEALDNKNQLDVIYTDCAKAFDKVDHEVLLGKLVDYGFSKNTHDFIKSYLTLRASKVKVGQVTSEQFIATSGVPQGSKLGPLLFILFINDLPRCVTESSSLLYADDFKIYRSISVESDCDRLQSDLNEVKNWFEVNKMYLNISKCKVVSYTRKRNVIVKEYNIDGVVIERSDRIKDLGVNFCSDLRFKDHFCYIANKAYRALGFVMRNSKSFNVDTTVRLYNALVRPHLEYASVVWMPKAEVNINLLEKVQKRFLRYLFVKKYNVYPYMISYKSMLDSFNFISLDLRRKRQALLFIYFIVSNTKYKGCELINYVRFSVPKVNLRILDKRIFFVDVSSNSPVNHMMSVCNSYLGSHEQLDIFNLDIRQLRITFNEKFANK